MSNLSARLHNMQPIESDAFLSSIWRKFAGSEQHDALILAIGDITRQAEAGLFAPGTPPDSRSHYAGQVASLRRLLVTIQAAIAFDPVTASYDTPDAELSDEIPADHDQLI